MKNEIYLATILLEKNRWSSRIPSYRVSGWPERIQKDGFDGLELWENHVLLAGEEELERLRTSPLPVAIYSSYVNFEEAGEEGRRKAAAAAARLGATGIKYNLGPNPADRDTYLKDLKQWAGFFPAGCRLLCECHENTIAEVPEAAARIFEELPDIRFQAIVHPFEGPEMLSRWFQCLGGRITHIHLRLREKKHYFRLREKASLVKESVRFMEGAGFNGTYTVEFTGGVRTPDENIEDLYRSALDDLHFLREEVLR